MGNAKAKLRPYRSKRDFTITNEPKGKKKGRKPAHRLFVVQKHASSTLHYDFRFSHKKVLKSWILPKGPSLNPSKKRVAVATEDHPVEYAFFEGPVPSGQYGEGEIIIWDQGRIKVEGKTKKSLKKGKLRLHLKGKKLRGAFDLVRTQKGKGDHEDQWVLTKVDDEYAETDGRRKTVTSAKPESILSGETIEDKQTPTPTQSPEEKPTRNPADLEKPSGGQEEFTVVGWIPSENRGSFRSLLLATPQKDGSLQYVGKVGVGFTDENLETIGKRLQRLQRKTSPLGEESELVPDDAQWVRPSQIAEIRFTAKTPSGLLRHASFQNIRNSR